MSWRQLPRKRRGGIVDDEAVMSPLLPSELLSIAGAFALFLVWKRTRLPISTSRLIVETLVITVGAMMTTAALWALLWWIEQRW